MSRTNQPKPKKESITVKSISKIKSEKVSFLWKPYIPLGKVTIIEGDPGVGKSFLTLAIAAAISKEEDLPDQRLLFCLKKRMMLFFINI